VNNGFQLETCTDTGAGKNLSYANSGDYTTMMFTFLIKELSGSITGSHTGIRTL
jgi:hypothetical protein